MFLKYICFVLLLSSSSLCANILAIIPFPSYSHQIAYTHIWKELSLRGHKVTVITTDPLNDPTLTNLTEVDIHWSYKIFDAVKSKSGRSREDEIPMWRAHDLMLSLLTHMADEQLSYPPIQALIHNGTQFDVVLVEHFFPEFLGFAEIYNCPKIIISSFQTSAYYQHVMGNPTHPLLQPDYMTPFYGRLGFKGRIIATVFSWYLSYFFSYKYIPTKENLLRKHFNLEVSLDDLIKSADMMFVNENPVTQEPRAIGPNTINVGGFRTPLSAKPLPKDLEEFLNDAKDGFIYFSLGTNVKSKDLSNKTLSTIIETLQELPYKIVWKFEADELPGKPKNVKLIKWAPQQTVLSHPNIKLFITQGGLQSMEEAIFNEVPCVVIPFMADQVKNAHLMKNKGFAETIDRKPHIKKLEFKNTIMEVINNPSYKNSVKKLKQLVSDTPMTGLERAIWWTEYVIRNKGAKHLRNPAVELPPYQYYLLDVMAFIILVTLSLAAVIIVLIKKLKSLVYRVIHYTYSSKNKKKQ